MRLRLCCLTRCPCVCLTTRAFRGAGISPEVAIIANLLERQLCSLISLMVNREVRREQHRPMAEVLTLGWARIVLATHMASSLPTDRPAGFQPYTSKGQTM